ncbi:MAG: hypothetical protein V7749_00855 [Cocleimonas sp.]
MTVSSSTDFWKKHESIIDSNKNSPPVFLYGVSAFQLAHCQQSVNELKRLIEVAKIEPIVKEMMEIHFNFIINSLPIKKQKK